MLKHENHCVDCGLPCWGSSCPNMNVVVHYCDKCYDEDTLAEYIINGFELCEDCANQYIDSWFQDEDLEPYEHMTIYDKAEILGISDIQGI